MRVVGNSDDCGFAVIELIDGTGSWGSAGYAILYGEYHGEDTDIHLDTRRSWILKWRLYFFSAWKSWGGIGVHLDTVTRGMLKCCHVLPTCGELVRTNAVSNKRVFKQILKGSDDRAQRPGLLGFWSLRMVGKSKEHSLLETGSVSVLRWAGGRYLPCWIFMDLRTETVPVSERLCFLE
jgi:hypothetical protein